MTTPARVQRGVPTGGQFAAQDHQEPDVALEAWHEKVLATAARQCEEAEAEMHRIRDGLATLSAQRLAMRTLQMYPTAASIRLSPDYDSGGMELEGVYDGDGKQIVDFSDFADPEYHRWANFECNGTALNQLARNLPSKDATWWKHARESSEDQYESSWLLDIKGAAEG